MARIATGSIIADISGKVGDEIFSRNRQGPYVKAYAIPIQPDSASQLDARTIFANAVIAWNLLSDSDYLAYKSFAERHLKPTFNGSVESDGVRSFFIGNYINKNTTLTNDDPLPVDPEDVGFKSINVAFFTSTSLIVQVVAPTFSANHLVKFFASDRRSLGTRSINSFPSVNIQSDLLFPPIPTEIYGSWIDKYPGAAPTASEKVFVSVHLIHLPSGIRVGYGWNSAIGAAASPPYNLGNETIRASSSTLGTCQAILVTTIQAGTIAGLTVYIDTSGGFAKVGIWSDSGGNPDVLLASSLTTSIPTGGVWQTINLTAPFIASAATIYHIGIVGDLTPLFREGMAPLTKIFHPGSGYVLVNPFVSPTVGANGPSLYATVTP